MQVAVETEDIQDHDESFFPLEKTDESSSTKASVSLISLPNWKRQLLLVILAWAALQVATRELQNPKGNDQTRYISGWPKCFKMNQIEGFSFIFQGLLSTAKITLFVGFPLYLIIRKGFKSSKFPETEKFDQLIFLYGSFLMIFAHCFLVNGYVFAELRCPPGLPSLDNLYFTIVGLSILICNITAKFYNYYAITMVQDSFLEKLFGLFIGLFWASVALFLYFIFSIMSSLGGESVEMKALTWILTTSLVSLITWLFVNGFHPWFCSF